MSKGTYLKSSTTTNPVKMFWHKLVILKKLLFTTHFYAVGFKLTNEKGIHDVHITTFNCNNKGVADISEFLYKELGALNSVDNQIQQILNQTKNN